MAGKVKTICEQNIVPIIEQEGYEVVELEYAKKSDGMNLTFYIDNEQGIQIEDCEKVSKLIDGLLDELDPTDGQTYILSVSSPGIDRPIKSDKDFKRNLNKDVKVTLFAKVDGKKEFEGQLIAYDDIQFTIKSDKNETTFTKQQVAHIVPIIKF